MRRYVPINVCGVLSGLEMQLTASRRFLGYMKGAMFSNREIIRLDNVELLVDKFCNGNVDTRVDHTTLEMFPSWENRSPSMGSRLICRRSGYEHETRSLYPLLWMSPWSTSLFRRVRGTASDKQQQKEREKSLVPHNGVRESGMLVDAPQGQGAASGVDLEDVQVGGENGRRTDIMRGSWCIPVP
jgi:hypothetical protein